MAVTLTNKATGAKFTSATKQPETKDKDKKKEQKSAANPAQKAEPNAYKSGGVTLTVNKPAQISSAPKAAVVESPYQKGVYAHPLNGSRVTKQQLQDELAFTNKQQQRMAEQGAMLTGDAYYAYQEQAQKKSQEAAQLQAALASITRQERAESAGKQQQEYSSRKESPNAKYFVEAGKNSKDNEVEASRANWQQIAYNEAQGIQSGGRSIYRHMTDEEVNTYNYILGKDGKQAAKDYLLNIEEALAQREGEAQAKHIEGIGGVGERVAKGVYGMAAGSSNALEGMRQNRFEDALATGAMQFGSQKLRENMSGLGGVAYDLSYQVGNMLPSMIVSTALGGSGLLAKGAASAYTGFSAKGNAYNQAIKDGYSKEQAQNYSTLIGASEGILQYLLSGIGKMGGIADDVLLAKVKGIDNALARLALTGLIKVGGEVAEEELQLIIEPTLRSLILNEEFNAPTWNDVAYTALLSALTVGAMEGVPNAAVKGIDLFTKTAQDLKNKRNPQPLTPAAGNAPEATTDSTATNGAQNAKKAYVGNMPQNVEDPRIKSIETTAAPYLTEGETIETASGNKFRNTVRQNAQNRLGIQDGKPAYLVASNITKDGETYYAKVTPASLNKMLFNAKNETLPIERLLVVDNIEKIFDDAVWAYSEGDRKGRDQINGFDTLRASFYIDGEPYFVDIKVKVLQETKASKEENIAYFLEPESIEQIKKAPASPRTGWRQAPNIFFGGNTNASFDANSVAQPAEAVNTNTVGAASADFFESQKTTYDRLVDQSTEFHDRGANPRDDIYFEVPKTDVQGRDISRSASNIVGAKAIPADVVPDIEQLIADGKMSYNKLTDQKSLFRAEMTIRNQGFDGAMERFRSNALKGKIDKDTVSLGFTLLNNAANAHDGAAVAELCSLIQGISTNAGQALQAFNILRKMSPQSQLYAIQKMVDNLNEDVRRKKPRKGKKGNKDNGVPVDQWMQKTGEMLAKQLGESVKTKPEKVQTVSQRVLADLRKLAKETVTPAQKAKSSRTEMDSIYDMFNNQEQYEKALAAAKETVAKEYGNDPEVMAALDEWMDSAFDYTLQFTKEVTGQGDIKVSNKLMTKFLEQTTDEGRDAVKKEIYAEIAAQIPSTFAEKWNSWRYMSMLVNPRTHIRNVSGNTFFQPVRFIKNEIAAGLEAVWAATGHDIQRTKSAVVSPALYKAAWADFDNVKDLVAGNKYSDTPMSAIQDKRKIYKNNKVLEFIRSKNMEALSVEDTIFKRITYADSLAGYLKANGVTAEQMANGDVNESTLSAARDYAAQEALKATYQDDNAISRKTTQIVKSLGAFGEAVMPFKKTPANVLARSLEYSPVGLAKALTYDLHKVKSGDINISQAFDNIAAGATGSAIFALGVYLFAQGVLRAKQGDEEEDKWDELLGHQGYSIELGDGTSITLDWLAPAAMPLFMGAEFMSSVAENGFNAQSIIDSLYAMSDPLLEMSMLQSLNDMIESVGYAKTSGLVSVVGSAISSYFSQAIPTLFGQIERVGETERMTAYTDKNSPLPTDVQYFLSKASAKFFGDYKQIPYIDAWGRTEETGNLLERAANNFLNPAYVSKVDMDSVESAIQKVYDATGNSSVFPERAERSIDVGKGDDRETKHLTAQQYVHYAKTKGEKSYQYAKEAIATDAYRSMTQEERADYIAKMYGYADYKAKRSIFSNAAEGNTEYPAYAEAEKKGISPAEFYFMKDAINNDVKGIPDEWGNTKSGTYKDAVEEYIDDQDLTPIQKDWLLLWKFKSTNKNPTKAKQADAKTLAEAPWN